MRIGTGAAGVFAVIVTAPLLTGQTASAATRAWWHMNERSGSTMHDAVGSADGTTRDVTKNLLGMSRTAYGFNGSSSYVSVPHRPALNPGTARLGVKIAVRFSSIPPQDYDLIRKGRSTTPGGDYKIEIAHSGQALCHFRGSKRSATLIGGPKLNDGKWHRISCIRGARSVRLFVDHVRRKLVWRALGSIANTATLFIGAKPGSDWHKGRLDEAKIIAG